MSLYKRIKKTVGKAYRAYKVFARPGKSIARIIGETVRDVSSQYPPQVARILKECGNDTIKSIQICKEVVQKNTEYLLKALAGEKTWEEAKKKHGFDKFYHLFMIVDLGSKKLHIEKNEVVRISYNPRPCPDGMTFTVPKSITLNELLERTRERIGDKDFFVYDPLGNNCQAFVNQLLRTLGLWNNETSSYVYQNIKGLREDLPQYTRTVAKGLTDLGALANTAYQKTKDYIENGSGED
jgi:hypothetical protein